MPDRHPDPRPDSRRDSRPDIGDRLEDLLHVSIGLGILAFQKAQVHRQEIQKALRDQFGGSRG